MTPAGIAEALMAEINCPDVYGHREEIVATLARLLAPAPLDEARLRGAFIRAGIVWVLPAKLFDEAVAVVAREYAA